MPMALNDAEHGACALYMRCAIGPPISNITDRRSNASTDAICMFI